MSPPRRQLRPTVGTAGAAALAFIGWKTAANTGSSLGIAVCFAALAAVALDAGWAALATRRVGVTAAIARPDVVVGDSVAVEVQLHGPRHVFTVRVSEGEGGPAAAVEPPGRGPLLATASSRGVRTDVEIETLSHGFCGLLVCSRRHQVELPRVLHVGPRPLVPDDDFPDLVGGFGEGPPRPAPVGDSVRSVRAYTPGDALRQVHWRASARHGDLVVKDVEEPAAPELTMWVDLGGGGHAGEQAARRAAWYAREALRRGYVVVLATHEGRGRVTGPVNSVSAVNCRLAMVVPGTPADPGSTAAGRAVLMVTDTGDRWLH